MEGDGGWVLARRSRKPLQTKLIPHNYQNVAVPKRVSISATPAVALKDTALMAFGFTKNRLSPNRKRKREVFTAFEVNDSEGDSDGESVVRRSSEVIDLSMAFDKLSSPSKRQKAWHTGGILDSVPPSDEAPSSPLASARYQAFVMPRRARAIDEVPSSLSFERYDYRAIDEPDTPSRARYLPRTTVNAPLSPPLSSRLPARKGSFSKSNTLFRADTPTHVLNQLHTPPASHAANYRGKTGRAESSPLRVLPDEPLSDDVQTGDKENIRPPLEELSTTLIPTIRARESRFSGPSRQTPSRASSAASLVGSVDLPTVWHDAVEYQSPGSNRKGVIEDSQYQDLFDSLSPLDQFPATMSPTTPQSCSWAADSSLMETCLPPDFHPSPSTQHSRVASPHKRKASHAADGYVEGKRQKNYELECDAEHYSFGLDESLMDTLPPLPHYYCH